MRKVIIGILILLCSCNGRNVYYRVYYEYVKAIKIDDYDSMYKVGDTIAPYINSQYRVVILEKEYQK